MRGFNVSACFLLEEVLSAGRYAPSPSGELHLGNLRTAILAWLFARSTGRRFLLRVEDLDRARAGSEEQQISDLRRIGLTWDETPLRQTDRGPLYQEAIAKLQARGLLYECFCTRRDIAEAASAPHAAPGAYPGICRNLTEAQREEKRQHRPAALRLRSDVTELAIVDELHGTYVGLVDDFVVLRNDGVPAYNFATVLDDLIQGIDQVVRGEDLLSSAPRQSYLRSLLLPDYDDAAPILQYAHVPMVLNSAGQRLAKRDGAVTLADLELLGLGTSEVVAKLLLSVNLPGNPQLDPAGQLAAALQVFDPDRLPREPWIFTEF